MKSGVMTFVLVLFVVLLLAGSVSANVLTDIVDWFKNLFGIEEPSLSPTCNSANPIRDVNKNGDVDAEDIQIVNNCVSGLSSCTPENMADSDVDCDGDVDAGDIQLMLLLANEICDDSLDNDADTFADCNDNDCLYNSACTGEQTITLNADTGIYDIELYNADYMGDVERIEDGTTIGLRSSQDSRIGAVEFTIPDSSIPDNAIITDVKFNFYVTTACTSCNVEIKRMAGTKMENVGDNLVLWQAIYDATDYHETDYFQTTGAKTRDLGIGADADLQAQLSANYFGIGLVHVGSTENPVLGTENPVFASSENIELSYRPNLVVTYTVSVAEICDNLLDDDSDGQYDFADADCVSSCVSPKVITGVVAGTGVGAPFFTGQDLSAYAGCCNNNQCYSGNQIVGGCYNNAQVLTIPAGQTAVCSVSGANEVWCAVGYVNDGAGVCVAAPVCTTAAECDNGLYCNGAETCISNACVAGTPLNVDDGIDCTVDSCDEVNDVVVHTPNDALCNDNLFCTGTETCSPALGCQSSGTPCVAGQTCDETNDICESGTTTPTDYIYYWLFDNSLIAQSGGIDFTLGAGSNVISYVAGHLGEAVAIVPNSWIQTPAASPIVTGNSYSVSYWFKITSDGTNEVLLASQDSVDNNDAYFVSNYYEYGLINVNGADRMRNWIGGTVYDSNDLSEGLCLNNYCHHVVVLDGNTNDFADYVNGVLVASGSTYANSPLNNILRIGAYANNPKNTDANIDDLKIYNRVLTASEVQAIYNEEVTGCTDTCLSLGYECGTQTVCGSSVNCGTCATGICSPAGVCEATPECTTAAQCDDSNLCTTDTCSSGTCVHAAINCNDNLFCTGTETCSLALGCQSSGTPCVAGQICDETNNQCNAIPGYCDSPDDCDDGLYCNGAETCNLAVNTCSAGTAPVLSEGIACTVDSCDEVNNVVVHTPNNALCNDGLFCTQFDTCDANLDCQYSLNSCNPGQTCNEDTNTCDSLPDYCTTAAECDNGNACDGAETCISNACVAGTALNVDDSIGCTVDTCNPLTGAVHTPSNNLCDDNLFCNGVEICSATLDCQAGINPCTAEQGCDDVNNVCGVIPGTQIIGWCPAIAGEFDNLIPATVRVNVQSLGGLQYCDPVTLNYKDVVALSALCSNDYECQTNTCVEGTCVAFKQEFEAQTSLLRRIYCWVAHPFNEAERNICIGGG